MPSPRIAQNYARFRPSIYSTIRVPHAHRAKGNPRVARPYRTKSLTNLTAFYRNRFYEIDRWYKARIVAPLNYPQCYEIDPEEYQVSLADRLKAESEAQLDPELNEPVDIGLPFSPTVKVKEKTAKWEDRAELEKLARHRKLVVHSNEVENDVSHVGTVQPQLLKRLAEHFAIFRDLFHPDAHFYPVVPLSITYDFDDDTVTPVHFGNTIKPEEASTVPTVFYPSKSDTLWTLLMVNPDGNIYEENKDVAHWLVANIPGNQVSKGDVVHDYLQPLPLLGTGWHRVVFVLFQQTKAIATETLGKSSSRLEDRTFSTADFYKRNEDVITPAGLSFFQADWDISVTDCFHKRLHMQEPTFEYEWPKPDLPKQIEFPKFMSFNKYMDMYRDPKELEQDVLVKRLKRISPFEADEPQLRYPNIFRKEDHLNNPSWLASEKEKERQGLGRYAGIYKNVLPP